MYTKKSITLATFIILAVVLNAQDAIDKYFESYSENPEFTSITISSKMFELFSSVNTDEPEGEAMKEAIKGVRGIRILAYDKEESGQQIYTSFSDVIKTLGKEYELLMSVDEKDEKVRFFILEENDKISELFMMVGGSGNLFLMSLIGDIDLAKVSELSKGMNIGGIDYLENLDEKNKSK
jgi:hypothetical protein